MRQALLYSFKVWLTTALVNALVTILIRYFFLYRKFNPLHIANPIFNWLIQLGVVALIYAVLFIPLGAMIYCTVVYSKRVLRRLALKTKLYIVGFSYALLLDTVLFTCLILLYGINRFYIYRLNMGLMISIVICIPVAVLCVRCFDIEPVANEIESQCTSKVQQ